MEYPAVKRAHIVPQTYLRNFADRDRIVLRLVGSSEAHDTTIDRVAVRKRFYRRTRTNGTKSDDVEWALSVLEGAATPLLRELDERWPLSGDDKSALAEFFAAQHVRVPRWFRHHAKFLEEQLENWRAGRDLTGLSRRPTHDELTGAAEVLGSDTQALVRMLSLIPKVKSLFASMHWTLLQFNSRTLALSDDPVVSWPLHERARPPVAGSYGAGLLPTLEWFVPVSARSAVVMSWIDEVDPSAPVAGAKHHAKTINAFVVAQADRQWFHHPATRPKRASGLLLPLTPQLYPGYSAASAVRSQRRAKIGELLNARKGSTLDMTADMVAVHQGRPR